MGRLQGKHALITGGSSGIGLETARRFLAEGASVAITGRNEAALSAACATLGHQLVALRSDAGSVGGQRQLARDLEERWGRLDVLFVNAADVTHRPLPDWDEDAFDQVLNTNVKGPFFLLQALLPLLRPGSSVILCGSVSAHIGLPQSSVYAASKAALLSLARTLSAELLSRQVRINGLSPGPTATPALEKLGLEGEAEQALRREIISLVPMQRMGTPDELAAAAVFLASDESAFMLASELLVDGGVANI